MGGGGNEEDGMHNTTLVRTALFVLCAACRYSAADRDRTGDYRLTRPPAAVHHRQWDGDAVNQLTQEISHLFKI